MGKPVFLYGENLDSAVVTATDSATGLDPNNVLFAAEDTFWAPANSSGDKVLTIDRGQTGAFDAVAILGASLSGVSIVISVCDTIDGTYWEVLSDAAMESDFNSWWGAFLDTSPPNEQYVRVTFSGMGAEFFISFILFTQIQEVPQFTESTNLSLSPEGNVQIGGNGAFIGSNHLYTHRELSIKWPDLTPTAGTETEVLFEAILAWADWCIKYLHPFFFVTDRDDTEVYFAWMDKPKFVVTLKNKDLGIYSINNLMAKTRVA